MNEKLHHRGVDGSPLFRAFLVRQPLVELARQTKTTSLKQEWCQNIGVIADPDETGFAMEAIKA